MNHRQLFLQHVGQTSPAPLALHIVKAKGSRLFDAQGREYIDLIAGISVSNIGHAHPKVIRAIKQQADKYLHLLVYGELVETPQVEYARLLTQHLPPELNMVYFTNSGAEAVEGAMKLAKRFTGRTNIVAFRQSYHGSTQGALSLLGDEYWRNAYRPLLPGIRHVEFNDPASLEAIDTTTACVVIEPVQAERGVIVPDSGWMQQLREACTSAGALLIMDCIQTGFGRTGVNWGFETSGIIPDILLLGKALGGGMPLGAFIANRSVMTTLTHDPVLGHITTFGGHPVSCAAGQAAFRHMLKKNLVESVKEKSALFVQLLKHPLIREVRAAGLLIAIEFESFELNKKVIERCLEKGLLTDWFLFAPQCLRIAPPLTMTKKDIRRSCAIILEALDHVDNANA